MSHVIRWGAVGVALSCAWMMAAPAQAQWSSDPSGNLVISERPGRQTGARIVATADGGFYVAWEDPASPVRVQRLDAAGREQWPHDGVATATAGTFTDLTIDADGNAIIALLAGTRPAFVKVAPDGGFPWGAGGRILPDNASSTVRAAATSDGGLVGLWNEGRGFRLQKLDVAGVAQWGAGVPIAPEAPYRGTERQLVAADAGSVILAWVADGYPVAPATAFAQKFAADGTPLWNKGQPLAVSAVFNNVMHLALLADGGGGAIAAWDDGDVGTSVPLKVKVQHLDRDGAARLGPGGREVVSTAHKSQASPALAHDPASGAIHVLWSERIGNPYAVFAQRIETDGRRAFGEGGKLLQSAAENTGAADLIALPAPDGLLAAWTAGFLGQVHRPIHVVRLDAHGNHLFPGERVGLKRAQNRTLDNRGALSTAGYAAFVWGDQTWPEVGEDDILAQNIRFDGTLGNPLDTVFADGFES